MSVSPAFVTEGAVRLPFSLTKEHYAGLDISSTAVKFLNLGQHGGGYRVDAFALEPLPREAVANKMVQDIEAVGNAIKRAVARARSKVRHVAIAVPGSSVITKTIPMPAALTEDEIAEQLSFEAERYIPYPMDEVYLDFEVQGPSAEGTEMVDVLVAASRSENVDNRVAAVELAGLTPVIVDVESFALERLFPVLKQALLTAGEAPEIVALADVGATTTTLCVFEEDRLVYTREQAFGATQLEEEIQTRYGMEPEDAARAQRMGELPEGFETELLEPFQRTTAQQLERALQVFLSSTAYQQVDHVLLGGGCVAQPGFVEAVAQQLELPVTLANPLSGMAVASEARSHSLGTEAPTMLAACGLGLRSFIKDDHR